jgi:uncharacterized protein
MDLTTERVNLDMERDELRLVVVADTHSAPHARTTELVTRERPDRILHAGDIGDLRVIDSLSEIAPTLAVRGNIDRAELPDVLAIDLRRSGASLAKLLLIHIGVSGPKLRTDAARRARAEDASLVVCGHSHVPFVGRDRDIAIFNPGSIGPRRFDLPIVFGVIEVSRERIAMFHVDCETGERWRPRALSG